MNYAKFHDHDVLYIGHLRAFHVYVKAGYQTCAEERARAVLGSLEHTERVAYIDPLDEDMLWECFDMWGESTGTVWAKDPRGAINNAPENTVAVYESEN